MPTLKQLNEAVNEEARDKLKKSLQANLLATYNIKTNKDAITGFVDGGDYPGLDKLVNDMEKAGFDTGGAWEENKAFLEKMGFTKHAWITMQTESFVAASKVANKLLGEEKKKPGKKPVDADSGILEAIKKAFPSDDLKTINVWLKSATEYGQPVTVDEYAEWRKRDEQGNIKEDCGKPHMEDEEKSGLTRQQEKEIDKLWNQYQKMDRLPTGDDIADDLEMLDYSPEEVELMTKYLKGSLNSNLKAGPFAHKD